MCFLITAVVEFLVVVQTGAIDLPMGRGSGGEGGSGGGSCLMADKNTWTPTHTHSCGLMPPPKQITTSFTWKVFLSDTLWSDRTDAIQKFTVREQIWKRESAVALSLFNLSYEQKPLHFNASPPFLFPCLWTSALRASVSRHKPEGDTLSSILRYMVLNEERAGKQTACLHINTLCHCPPLTKLLTC